MTLLSTERCEFGYPPYAIQTAVLTESGMVYDEIRTQPMSVIALGAVALLVGFFAGRVWSKQSPKG